MPTYDYECDACGHTFELFQSISEPVKKKCPECGKPKLRRLFGTGAAVMFKGSGFYQTDYRSDSYKKARRERQAGQRIEERQQKRFEVKTESKSESKTETNPDAKPKSVDRGKKGKKTSSKD